MPIQSKFNALHRVALGTLVACGLMLPVGCSGPDDVSLSGSSSVNNQGVTTETVTLTGTWHRKKLQQFAAWMDSIAGSDLANLDPSQAIVTYSLSNAVISSTSGLVTVTLTDDNTGVVVGQQTFQYVVNGNGLFAQDPSAVSSWLSQFTSYSALDVTVSAPTDMQATSSGSAIATGGAVYQGVTYASASVSWAGRPPAGGGGCHTPRCPNQ